MTLPIINNLNDLRAGLLPWREAGQTVALVPTMGALHRGHIALVDEARRIANRVIVSIFVNPLQFAPHEDFSAYPRQIEEDHKLLAAAGCDMVYSPAPEAMYGAGFSTSVVPGDLANRLEGEHRPGHFTGVATVVVKLLLQALPDFALFGEKDYQQMMVIRQVVRDLDLPVSVLAVPTVRDTDGLALSSRNAYLSVEERHQATLLPRTLAMVAEALGRGQIAQPILQEARQTLTSAGFRIDYIELVDAQTLVPADETTARRRLVAAVWLGKTRLIDNMEIL